MSNSSISRKPRAENRPSIGFARHRRFASEEQPSIGAFAQVLAHRVRGLLTTIEGFTDLLIPSLESADQRDLAFRILESTSRIEGILHDLQHYNDPIEAHFHKVPADTIWNDLKAVLADSELGRITVHEHVPDTVFVRADESLIRQALMALLRNAFEASTGSEEPIRLSIELDKPGHNVVVSVRNPGPIKDMEISSRMFEAFFTTKAANLGLGLTLARRIARVHGGELSTAGDSDADHTELRLLLPVMPA